MLSPVIGDAYFLPVGVVFTLTLLAAAAFGVWTLFVLLFVLSESGAALSFDGFSVMSDFSYVSVYVIAYVENLSVSNDIVCALPSFVDSSISLYS